MFAKNTNFLHFCQEMLKQINETRCNKERTKNEVSPRICKSFYKISTPCTQLAIAICLIILDNYPQV